MWQYYLDDDHFYDLRDLPVGNWSASSITCRPNGPWLTFSHPSRNRPINPLRRVHPEERYIPPIAPLNNALCQNVEAPPPDSSFLLTNESLRALNEGHAARNPPTEFRERSISQLSHSGTLFQRSLKSLDRRPKTTVSSLCTHAGPPVSVLVLEDENLPDQKASFDHRTGVQRKEPFRLSQIEVRRQIHEQMYRLKKEEMERRRPSTTNAYRMPFHSRNDLVLPFVVPP
jgi:hypothetical protein